MRIAFLSQVLFINIIKELTSLEKHQHWVKTSFLYLILEELLRFLFCVSPNICSALISREKGRECLFCCRWCLSGVFVCLFCFVFCFVLFVFCEVCFLFFLVFLFYFFIFLLFFFLGGGIVCCCFLNNALNKLLNLRF